MADPNKFSVEDGEQGFTLKVSEKTDITDAELVDILGNERIAGLQKLQLAKKKEQYESLKPAGFDDAPESVKAKWEKYKNTDNLEKLQWIHDNVSYNADHTMNIIKLKKTFCEDISGQNKRFTWEQAQELEKTNAGGYKLMSDYNGCDADKKEQTDRYKVINIFSNGNGDTVEGMVLFKDMAGCNDRYWTTTPYKDENGTEVKGVALIRRLSKDGCNRTWDDAGNSGLGLRVCGFKDSMKVA
ncbi:MAG: hypothetical protein WC875_04570 [Candidatus Absconditabacterales bacterium]